MFDSYFLKTVFENTMNIILIFFENSFYYLNLVFFMLFIGKINGNQICFFFVFLLLKNKKIVLKIVKNTKRPNMPSVFFVFP